MIGKILGGRYQIESSLGEGGMARVFKARDLKLNRIVAVKVLHEHLTGNQDFVRRFRREAQAVAKFSHPSIVSLYDVGEEDNIYYIVMECLQGKTLKELIKQEGRLPAEDAVEIACQVCDALVHAHRQNIIHRDIKPQNIVITGEGRVKVTDFGIAQAASAATITYGESVMGSVYYFSPEQARGSVVGKQSDIYSLGIVLYEMLTGVVPFEGESPVSVAVKHLQEEITPPRQINPDIPLRLERIVMRAVQKDQASRYQSAEKFVEDLEGWLLAEGRFLETDSSSRKNKGAAGVKSASVSSVFKKMLVPGMVVVLTIFIVLGFNWARRTLMVPELEVPDLRGRTLKEAESILADSGFTLKEKDQIYHESIPEGHIVSQDPEAGSTVRRERAIEVVVSLGPEMVKVPSLEGCYRLEADLLLKDAGLVMEVEEEYSDSVPAGQIIRQDPRGGFSLRPGETVLVVISKGYRPFPIKNLQGLDLEEARDWLSMQNLILRNVDQKPSPEKPGKVLEQFPAAGEMVRPGDTVDLVISEGPEEDDKENNLPVYDIEFLPAVSPGTSIRISIEDALGARVLYEGLYEGGAISVKGIGSGKVVLAEKLDDEFVIVDSWDFP